ncbi:lactonase family protein [Tamlana sp. 62-3]|uniref:Lactonase family protein n=1 Tax=Neotamlana sargassicola TaxID=2883125 RepID=A0A9X1I6B8_9FLAO|nr:lactonase family protein [Tamlana sargassicola]MCB4807001.1 lactonase family protein [Tamlana sargassicola]
MKPIWLYFLIVILYSCKTTSTTINAEKSTIPLYVGTFTTKDSKGIYHFLFNTKTGALTNQKLAAETSSPNYMVYSKNRKHLYTANRSGNPDQPDFISAFNVNKNGTLTLINTQNSQGKSPCHVTINEEGTLISNTNYNGGTVSLYQINKDGGLTKAKQVFNHNAKNQTSHAHSSQFYKNELFVADLGRNAIYQYVLNEGEYKLQSEAIVNAVGNPGPRHFTISQNGTFIYVINEYENSITSIKRDDSNFKTIDLDTTLMSNTTEENFSADIHLSKNQKYLYVTNRGENTVAVFNRNTETGTIEKIQNISVEGDWPRNFTIDPTGTFLLVANRRSNNISVFKINQNNGQLSFLHDVKTPSPVFLLF